MAKNTKKAKRSQAKAFTQEQIALLSINPNAAGIDIGSAEHWVAVPKGRAEHSVRKFGCFTADLHAMAVWLKLCGITTVAMESTGVYWIPPFQILESHGFEVKLVNARHVANVSGRKTDVSDCQWIQTLHTYGLLAGSFRPDNEMCVLRSYYRHRDNLVKSASSQILLMQKSLIQMNLQIHKVISDITGATGMRIIRAILAGERDAQILALMRAPGVKRTKEDIMKALQGDYRVEHLFTLNHAVELYDTYQEKIRQCDEKIELCLKGFDGQEICDDMPPSAKKGKNKNAFTLQTELYRITGVDFTAIDGLSALAVSIIISEVGFDYTAFPTEKHFASWLGLSPNNRITGGKIKKTSTKRVFNRAANMFRLAAQSLANSRCAIGAFYRRLRSRLGAPKAITATAHKLARIFYAMWKTKSTYNDVGADYYEKQYKERLIHNIKRKAKEFGFKLVPLMELAA
jgi:transposase